LLNPENCLIFLHIHIIINIIFIVIFYLLTKACVITMAAFFIVPGLIRANLGINFDVLF